MLLSKSSCQKLLAAYTSDDLVICSTIMRKELSLRADKDLGDTEAISREQLRPGSFAYKDAERLHRKVRKRVDTWIKNTQCTDNDRPKQPADDSAAQTESGTTQPVTESAPQIERAQGGGGFGAPKQDLKKKKKGNSKGSLDSTEFMFEEQQQRSTPKGMTYDRVSKQGKNPKHLDLTSFEIQSHAGKIILITKIYRLSNR